MSDLLARSAAIIDGHIAVDQTVHRNSHQLYELAAGIAYVESLCRVTAIQSDAGLIVVDTSSASTSESVVAALDAWSSDSVNTIIYTHGHVDHVGGSGAFLRRSTIRGDTRPNVISHFLLPARLERYNRTNGYNCLANYRQFGWMARQLSVGHVSTDAVAADFNFDVSELADPGASFLPDDVAYPDQVFDEKLEFCVGGINMELNHARGETDDHAWVWLPDRRALCTGDLVAWVFPNAGNPQKVQRYPLEWAAALRAMVDKKPDLLLPGHGLPISGEARIRYVLETVADTLEILVGNVLEMMNAGADLDSIIREVSVPEERLRLAFLRPTYDEPEFVVRNIWRLYGGWWDGNPRGFNHRTTMNCHTQLLLWQALKR